MGGETDDHIPSRRRTSSVLSGVSSATSSPPSPRLCGTPSPKLEAKQRPALMRCRYYYVGCHDMVDSAKYAQHLEDFQLEHLRLLETTVALQSQRITHLEATLAIHEQAQKETENEPHAQNAPVAVPNVRQQPTGIVLPVLPFLSVLEQIVITTMTDAVAQVKTLFAALVELLSDPKEEAGAQMAGQLRTWQILYLFVLSFIVCCYFLLAGMGRLWALLQLLPLIVYLALMFAHWRHAAMFSAMANTWISLTVQCMWVGINLFLPVF